jgi:hypothetical protein
MVQIYMQLQDESCTDVLRVLADVMAERRRQDDRWGGPTHDASHHATDWQQFRDRYEGEIEAAVIEQRPADVRAGLVKVAALAVAQLQAHDRREAAR